MRKRPDRHETKAKDQIHEPINPPRHTQVTCSTTATRQNDYLGAVKRSDKISVYCLASRADSVDKRNPSLPRIDSDMKRDF